MAVLEEGVGMSGCGLGILQPLASLAKIIFLNLNLFILIGG